MEELLKDAVPTPDAQRVQRIRWLTAQMCGHSSYINEKANRIADRAGYYFSARRHQQMNGPDALMHDMRYSCLGAIRQDCRIRMQGQA